jgi:hypothetical protein
MKRYVGLIVAVLGVIIGGIAISNRAADKAREADRQIDLLRIQKDYAERAGWIRSNPDEAAYKEEVQTFLRWYFKEIADHRNQYGLGDKYDEYLAELDARASKGNAKDQELAERKAYYEYTKNVFDLMRSGKYQPLFSGTDKNMRLDIISADIQPHMGKPQVKLALVLWGAQREMRSEGALNNHFKMLTSASFNVTWKLFDEKGKLFGEMNASGDPSMKVDWPERFISAFPPQTIIGFYPMEKIPAEIAKMEIIFNVSSHAPSGGNANATFTWALVPPAEWKLGAGEKWEGAEESVRPEDEIDPSKRPNTQAAK